MKCSRRSSVNFTGRPRVRAAIGTSSSSGQGWLILTPKPPPTSGVITSTCPRSRLELRRDRRADAGRGLGRGPHLQPVDVGVPAGDGAAALHRHARAALDGEVELEAVRRVRDRGRGVAVVLLQPRADVAGHVVVDQVRGGAGVVDADHRRQELVGDPDPPHRVLGDVAVVGDDEGDRLADVVHLVPREGVLRAAVGERGVRDEQRQRLGHRPGEVVVGPHRVHALEVEHLVDVDVEDPRVGVRRAQHRRVQHLCCPRGRRRCRRRTGPGRAGSAGPRPAGPACRSASWSCVAPGGSRLRAERASKPSSAARSTAFTMFW